ncbi:copper chaperone PCu(A)C [Microbispora catharanthi]|uniref:Copper chaperone PCu(A)C n=1 Tax=Microbispora catharanthi TaxID=1712871 RepID=A0A5N6BIQ0_9ACTN|nr:copper chaperone PCu(A)C [Microbispora catharanthi]KAB8180120.1 copper chaperone PCu(A)C [Microbispora catharanthi]
MTITIVNRVLPAALAALLAAGACAAPSGTTTGAASPAAAQAPASAAAAPLSISDPWVKTARSGMSAAFATLVNTTGEAVTVVAASTPVSPSVELHEVVGDGGTTTMRRKQGGFVIPAGGRHVLQPGGDHIMLMNVRTAVEPGAEVPFTLTLKDGRTVSFTAVAKDFAGANESYAPHE